MPLNLTRTCCGSVFEESNNRSSCRLRAFAVLESQQRRQGQISASGVTGDERGFGGGGIRWV